jgi:ketol-acid reductoisomerase
MTENGIDKGWALKLIQSGWETITEALKQGGITNIMDRLSSPAKIKSFELVEERKTIMRPLFEKHMDDMITGEAFFCVCKTGGGDVFHAANIHGSSNTARGRPLLQTGQELAFAIQLKRFMPEQVAVARLLPRIEMKT